MDLQLWNAVDRRFRESDIEGAVRFLEVGLAKEETDRFKGLLDRGFTNPPENILRCINEFIDTCSREFDVQAVYLEMNGFDINPDRWYFDSFGYAKDGPDALDLEWLCDWQSPRWPKVTLEGLEPVQDDFAWYHGKQIYEDETFNRVYEHAVLLVMCKFVSLVHSAVGAGPRSKPIPVLATAHDFDIMGRFEG